VVRASWYRPHIFSKAETGILFYGHFLRQVISRKHGPGMSEELKVECYCMSHPSVGWLLFLDKKHMVLRLALGGSILPILCKGLT
jgi:hypothetical protein